MEQIRLLGATMLAVVSALVSPITWSAEVNGDATLTLAPHQVTDWLTLDGTVSAIHQGTVAAQTSGRVSRMLVDVNDEVVAGRPCWRSAARSNLPPSRVPRRDWRGRRPSRWRQSASSPAFRR